MVVSLARMLQSFGNSHNDLPSAAAKQIQQAAITVDSVDIDSKGINTITDNSANAIDANEGSKDISSHNSSRAISPLNAPKRVERICAALAQVHDIRTPTPLTDRYLANRAVWRSLNRPPFDPDTLWTLKHGRCPIMTELVDVVDEATLNAMPIEAVAILDRINGKLKRYRDWSEELNEEQQQQHNERQFVIDKLVNESIPEALRHYEQLLRFSPHRTRNSTVQGKMTAGDMLTDLFLEIDYELDELLDELHQTVLNRLASTHRYVKSRTQN